jgi:hypothetical protein
MRLQRAMDAIVMLLESLSGREQVRYLPFFCLPHSYIYQFVWSLSGKQRYCYTFSLRKLLQATHARPGHSGDSHDIPLVQFNKYPRNATDRSVSIRHLFKFAAALTYFLRLKVIEEMHAHSQYCQ